MGKKTEQFIGLDADGYEHPDPTPVEIPTRLKLPQRQVDRVREVIRREMSLAAQADGWESFDEADDFSIEGEDPVSPYEELFEPVGVELPFQRVAGEKGKGNVDSNRKDGVDGKRKAASSVGAGRSDKGARKAGGEADGAAGSDGGVGGAGEGGRVDSE